MRTNPVIRNPQHLAYTQEHVARSLDLFLNGKIPRNIAGWMVTTPLKHGLRAVYGSDLRAARILLWDAICARINAYWFRITYPWKKKEYERMEHEGEKFEN